MLMLYELLIKPIFWEMVVLGLIVLGSCFAPSILRQTRPHPWLMQQNRILAHLKFKSYEEFLDLVVRQNLLFCSLFVLSIGPVFSLYVRMGEAVWLWFATVPLAVGLGIYVLHRYRKVYKVVSMIYGALHFASVLVCLLGINLTNGNTLWGFTFGLVYWWVVYIAYFAVAYKNQWLLRFRP